MREIKFRGCLKIGDSWEYGGIRYGDMGQAYILPHGATSRVVLVNRSYVGQYTGLKDKNGVKIYEGDIISAEDPEFESGIYDYAVEFDEGVFWGVEITGERKKPSHHLCHLLDGEVIGNKFENPELLGGR